MDTQQPLIIYHGSCRDGFASAWCFWRLFPNADFFAAAHGSPPPDVKGRVVYMIDFSYPLKTMEELARNARLMVVLDHHVTAQDALRDFDAPNALVTFDMNRSGAGMAWDYLNSRQQRPWIIDYVEDRDLWRLALPESEAVGAYLSTIPYDFQTWNETSELDLAAAISAGKLIQKKTQNYVAEVAKNARRVTFEGFDVPVVNAPQVDISELVGYLSKDETFAMGWWQRSDGMFSYSLRSRGDFDVSELAKRHGGGGHKAAAGFQSNQLIF